MIENTSPGDELKLAFRELDALVGNDREGYWTARGVMERLRPLILAQAPTKSSASVADPRSIA
jgi:hypothetical protein